MSTQPVFPRETRDLHNITVFRHYSDEKSYTPPEGQSFVILQPAKFSHPLVLPSIPARSAKTERPREPGGEGGQGKARGRRQGKGLRLGISLNLARMSRARTAPMPAGRRRTA